MDKVNISLKFGLINTLGIVFIILKLCGVIDWSWWWVTAPLWIPFAILVILITVIFIIGKISDKRREKLWKQ